MGGIVWLFIVMVLVASIAFAPLGYFIYVFIKGSGKSLGKTDPSDHSVEKTKHYEVINSVMEKIFGKK